MTDAPLRRLAPLLALLLLGAAPSRAAEVKRGGPLALPPAVLTVPAALVTPLSLGEGTICGVCVTASGLAEGLLSPPAFGLDVPEIVSEAGVQTRLLLSLPDLHDGLSRLERLATLSDSPQPQAAQAGHAAALTLGVVTAPDATRLILHSRAHRGLVQTLDPDDAQALLATASLVQKQKARDPSLLARLDAIARTLKSVSSGASFGAVHAQLGRMADNSPLVAPAEDLSPNFRETEDPERVALAAESLRDFQKGELVRALAGVELPPVLAYKAAAVALRPDLKGVFSEVGAAQKISGDFYKIQGQKVIHASISPYAREASDLRYRSPNESPVSEDYTSLARLRQQLAAEYALLPPSPDKARFVVANTARTSWGNGHAWLGVLAQTDPSEEPVEILLHVRLLGQRTRNQKDVLGALGVSALYGAYHELGSLERFIRGLADGISKADFEVDYLSVRDPRGSELAGRDAHETLLREGLARMILLDPLGRPVAPSEAAMSRRMGRWTVLSQGRPAAFIKPPYAAAAPAQSEPELVDLAAADGYLPDPARRRWTFLASHPEAAAQADLESRFFPAARGWQTKPAGEGKAADHRGVTDFKAKRLNREAWVKGVFADIGGYQAVATRFFEASSTHSLFETVSFPGLEEAASRYGEGELSDSDFLRRQLDFELARMKGHDAHSKFGIEKAHRKFALVTHAEPVGGELKGTMALRLEDEPGGPTSDIIVAFRFRGGAWQQRRNALAALGVNLLYAAHYGAYPEASFLRSLREGLPSVAAHVRVLEATGAQAEGLGLD